MNALTEYQTISGEPLPPATGLYAAVAAQLDKSIATSRAFPRNLNSVGQVLSRLLDSNQAAESCVYTLEREHAGEKKIIQGPSARFAEALAYAYGNLRVDARVVDEKHDFIVVRGEVHDLERNVLYGQDVVRRIVGAKGRRFGPDMIAVTAMAAATIAQRDCVLKVIPSPLWRPAFEAALQRISGDTKTLADRRIKAVGQFSILGVSAEQVFKKLGVSGITEISAPHLVQLFGTFQAIKDGETSVAAEFSIAKPEPEKFTISPLAAPEDNGTDSNRLAHVEVEEDTQESVPGPLVAAPREVAVSADPGARPEDLKSHPLYPQLREAASSMAKQPHERELSWGPFKDFEDALGQYERDLRGAESIAQLRQLAAHWGSRPYWNLSRELSERADAVYEEMKAGIEHRRKLQQTEASRAAYEAAKDPSDIDAATEVYRDGPATPVDARVGALAPYESLRPRNKDSHETWESIVLDLLGAETEPELMERFTSAEKDGRVAKLHEDDQYNLRAVRLKIKKAKGWSRR